LSDTIALHQRLMAADPGPVLDAAAVIVTAMKGGGTLLAFGNGGSAADAQHVASELVGRFERHRRGFAAIALTTDASVLTSISNDYGYERVFARQLEALGRKGDVAMGITTSGASANVIAAFEAARARGLQTIALTGRDGGAAGRAVDIHINVPSDSTARIQEVHRTLLHVICDLVERALAG
jgi:phosphoheptose isomerase